MGKNWLIVRKKQYKKLSKIEEKNNQKWQKCIQKNCEKLK